MGIRGNVKRGPDGHLIHSNVDTDVIVSEEPPLGSTEKPEELYSIIERFCAGRCACPRRAAHLLWRMLAHSQSCWWGGLTRQHGDTHMQYSITSAFVREQH